jgi:hypothetical protein
MAKNTGRGSRAGSVAGRSQVRTSSGTWVKRDSSTGQFMATKRSGGSFKGVRREK